MSTASPSDPSFEEAIERLDEIAESMESEQLDLNEMVGRYEEGVRLLIHCRQRIDHARLRVERINALLDGAGKVTLTDFDVPAEAGEEDTPETGAAVVAAKGGARRSARPTATVEGNEDIRLF
jgi:exodeoxyribonuclease VII small subunit